MSLYEIGMLACFGASWPFSVYKTYKVKNPAGKSFLFLWLVFIGYISGVLHKCIHNLDFVLALYILNGLLVGTDLALCYYYRARMGKKNESSLPPA